jgi:hypothetical protein
MPLSVGFWDNQLQADAGRFKRDAAVVMDVTVEASFVDEILAVSQRRIAESHANRRLIARSA